MRRRVSIGTLTREGPKIATRTVSTTTAAPVPSMADFHPRVLPTAITMVSASTISTAQAKNTALTSTARPVGLDAAAAVMCENLLTDSP